MISGGYFYKHIDKCIYKTNEDIENPYLINKTVNYKLHRISTDSLQNAKKIINNLDEPHTKNTENLLSIKRAYAVWKKLNPMKPLSYTAFRSRCTGTWRKYIIKKKCHKIFYIEMNDVPKLKYDIVWLDDIY